MLHKMEGSHLEEPTTSSAATGLSHSTCVRDLWDHQDVWRGCVTCVTRNVAKIVIRILEAYKSMWDELEKNTFKMCFWFSIVQSCVTHNSVFFHALSSLHFHSGCLEKPQHVATLRRTSETWPSRRSRFSSRFVNCPPTRLTWLGSGFLCKTSAFPIPKFFCWHWKNAFAECVR